MLKPFLLAGLTGFLFYSCSQQGGVSTDIQSNVKTNAKPARFSLVPSDSYNFRRAYHGSENYNGSALDSFMNVPPLMGEIFDGLDKHPYYSALMEKRIIVNEKLYFDSLRALPDSFNLQISSSKSLRGEIHYLEEVSKEFLAYTLTLYDNEHLVLEDTVTCDFPPDLQFYAMDLDNDGRQEILSMYTWYFINGDNFDLNIYNLLGE